MVREVIRYDHDGRLNVFNEPPLDLEGNETLRRPGGWKCDGCGRRVEGSLYWLSQHHKPMCQRCWEKETP